MTEEERLIDEEQLGELARAVRLDLSESERASLLEELSRMLAFAGRLGEVDTAGVQEWRGEAPTGRALRRDEPRPSLPQEAALSLAPATRDGYFEVPRTLDEG